jgi:hypothetical protein
MSAFSGKVLQQEPLPGPVTHIQEVIHTAGSTMEFVFAFIKPPFKEELTVFRYPVGTHATSRPVHFWAADTDSGMICSALLGCSKPCPLVGIWPV